MSFSYQSFAAAQVAGQQINADLQAKRDASALQQQQIQSATIQNENLKQQQALQMQFMAARQKIIADHDQTLQQSQVANGQAPDPDAEQAAGQSISMYRQLADAALLSNPAMAEQYYKMADAAQGQAAAVQKSNMEIHDKRVKDMSSFAGAVLAGNVNQQDTFKWVKDNVGLQAALNLPTDPVAAQAYWKTKQTEGLSASDQINAQMKQQEFDITQKRLKDAADSSDADRALRRQEIAAQRDVSNSFRQQELDLKKEAGARAAAGGAIIQRNTIAAVNYANEATRGLDLVAQMGADQTASVFGHLQDGNTMLHALSKTGGNKLTPELQQIYQTATKGLGLELAQLATAGSGRAPNMPLIKEMGNMVEAQPGDKEYEVMFKLANAADFARTRLEAVPSSSDPKIQAIRERAEAALARYPAPGVILQQARAAGVKLRVGKGDVHTMREKLATMFGPDGTASDAAVAPPTVPSKIQSILDLYPAQH